MKTGKIAIAFTENTNRSDVAIATMRAAIEACADSNDCTVINGNKTTILFENGTTTDIDEIVDSIKEKVSCDAFLIDFQDEESIYKNFLDVNKEIGNLLTFKLLEAIGFDTESLDYKAIALRDYARFYR